MTYALVRNGIIEQVGPPRLWFDGTRWWDFRQQDPAIYIEAGWVLVTETIRPEDTATDTYDRSVELISGIPTEVWTVRPYTAEELAAQLAVTNKSTIQQQAEQALFDNRNFIASTPTQATAIAQTKALSQQVNGIIRLLLDKLDGTD